MQNVTMASNSGLKQFIIGKMWSKSQDGTRPGAIRVNRDLPTDIVLKAGTTLFLHENNKRVGKQDADFSVSVLLPAEVSNSLIAQSKALATSRVATA